MLRVSGGIRRGRCPEGFLSPSSFDAPLDPTDPVLSFPTSLRHPTTISVLNDA
jgi:hypothetical protein